MYIGRGLDQIDNVSTLDNLSFSGSTATFNLTQNSVAFTPVSADALQIQIDGVIQAGNYTVANATVTFDFTPSGSSVCNGIRHFGVGLLTTVSDSSITTAKLGADSVNGSKIADNSIDSEHYVDGSIDNAHIADDQIDSEHYADGSIDLAHMSSESVDEDNLQISNAGSNGQFLSKQSGNTGGLTWASAGGSHVLLSSTTTSDVSTYTTSGYADHSLYSFYKVYARLEFASNDVSLRFGFRASGTTQTATDYRTITDGIYNTAGTLTDENSNSWDVGEPNLTSNISYGYPTFITAEVYHDMSGGIGHYTMMKGTMRVPRWNGSAHQERMNQFSIMWDNSTNTDGFSFFASSGNIYRGEMYVYGVAK